MKNPPRRPHRPPGRCRSDAGVVEFTGMLPAILTTCLLGWEAFLIGMAATYAGHAANEGARIAAVGGSDSAVRDAAVRRVSGAWADEHNITVHRPAGRVCEPPAVPRADKDCGYVRVDIRPPLVIPGITLPMTVSARTKVVDEEAGAG